MPYTREHKERSRERILGSAAKLFPRLGYEAVSIDILMQDAGLTRGAFYAHFNNKSEVYTESIVYAAKNNPFAHMENHEQWLSQAIDSYLSREHLDNREFPCPLSFLVTDVSRSDPAVRNTYTRIYKNLNRLLKQQLDSGTSEQVMATTAMMIGGLAVARVLDDKRAADRLLSACRDGAKGLLEIN